MFDRVLNAPLGTLYYPQISKVSLLTELTHNTLAFNSLKPAFAKYMLLSDKIYVYAI